MYNVVYLDKATDEVDDAINWYEDQQAGLGERFVLEIQQCIDTIKKYPERQAPNRDGYRQLHLKKFPILVVYVINKTEKRIEITSVFHTKRHPQNKYRP